MIRYSQPEGVQAVTVDQRPLLTTPEGGKVALDGDLLALWQYAAGKTLAEVLQGFKASQATPQTLRAGLACLAEAGLLRRENLQPAAPEQKPVNGPAVAAVIVNYKSRAWLEECIPSLLEQTYSPLEIIVVDNGPTDNALAWLEAHYPQVRRLALAQTVSLAAAINAGVQASPEAAYHLLLNPDLRLEVDAVAEIAAVAEAHPDCGAVGTKLRFWWAPKFLNGFGNQVGPFSWGTDNAIGHLDVGQFDGWTELPSACFAATLVRKDAWLAVGPVDEGFPMYYEDAEWCYRARQLGWAVRAAPKAVVYHAFGGRVPGGEYEPLTPRKFRNVVYGRLRFTVKLLDEYFPRFLRNYLAEDWINFTQALLKRDWGTARAVLAGWSGILHDLGALQALNRDLRSRRKLDDPALFALQASIPPTHIWHGLPELTWDLVLSHYAPLMLSKRTRPMPEFDDSPKTPHLLIVSNDVVDEKMAGPGMRYLEMAIALSGPVQVTLAVPNETKLQAPGVSLVRYWEERPTSLQVLVENSDIALVTTYMVRKFPFLAATRTRLVVDLYDPMVLENLHYYLNEPLDRQQALSRDSVYVTNQTARLGDFFICGNERQRDFWLGLLASLDRINPLTFQQDPSLRRLIDVVSVGFPDRSPQHERPLLRGVHPIIPEDARIVLWGGGIWNWLDPLTLIRAWPQVVQRHPQARLVFLGTRHPNPLVPMHEMAQKAMQLAAEIGEKDKTILFIEWLAYKDREALLCEADVGVALHPIHVETRYSIRTRVLDYLWARLPVLVTEGDVTSEWVREYGLGAVVAENDAQGAAAALIEMLSQPKAAWEPAFAPLMERLRWSQVVAPLRRYCLEGGYAADRTERSAPSVEPAAAPHSGWARALYILRNDGPKALIFRLWRHLQWRLSRP